MKTGRSLNELAQEITRQSAMKRDFIADTRKVRLEVRLELQAGFDLDIGLAIQTNGHMEAFRARNTFHEQVAGRLKIPKPYYDRMAKDAPNLLCQNVNHWLHNSPEQRLIRTMDGQARAFLSQKYRTLDNYDLLECVLPVLQENECPVKSCEVTDSRLYLKALFPGVEGEVKKGDVVQAGVVISNSEIGKGSLRVDPLIWRKVCDNGMIASTSLKKYHVGRSAKGEFDEVQELFSDKTRRADDAAFWMKVRDVVMATSNQDFFTRQIEVLRGATEVKIENKDIPEVIEKTCEKFGIREDAGHGILNHLCAGGDFTQYGLLNAVTRASQDVQDYDEATELERVGGKVIELNRKEWEAIAA